jgi:3-dehydroquinate synthase
MIRREIPIAFLHRVEFTRNAFDLDNATLRDLIGADRKVSKVLFVVDSGLAETIAADLAAYFKRAERLTLSGDPVIIPGGEPAKNAWQHVETIWQAIHDHQLCRHSYVIAMGGGAILDLAGFAAATAHRGIRHVRMPTTTLSQGDGGVGVKNGVNYFGKKNWVGTFGVPYAVVNDLAFLTSLPDREKRSGLIEAVKVALIRDRTFYERIETLGEPLGKLDLEAVEEVIQKSAEHHVDHIATAGDPFELGSVRPLDFGHWAAHKLEQISNFEVTHGEAVAIGMALDLLYSSEIGLLPRDTVDRILKLLIQLGFQLYNPHLETKDVHGRPLVLRGLEEFREHLGGELTVTLLPKIGEKLEVHEMDETKVLNALSILRARFH